MTDHIGVPISGSQLNGVDGFRKAANLVHLHQNRVGDSFVNASLKAFYVGNKQVVTHQLNAITYAVGRVDWSQYLLVPHVPGAGEMAVLMAAVAKVFLYDMSDLTGLYRVASFLGLGVALIGIARIYQRFAPPAPAPEPEDA